MKTLQQWNSMGIWEDINKSGLLTAKKELSYQDMRDFMENLQVPDPNERQFVMHTGVGGMKMINHAMQASVYLEAMKHLNFSREERKRLGAMINSPDPENFEIAKILIDNKRKEAEMIRK